MIYRVSKLRSMEQRLKLSYCTVVIFIILLVFVACKTPSSSNQKYITVVIPFDKEIFTPNDKVAGKKQERI